MRLAAVPDMTRAGVVARLPLRHHPGPPVAASARSLIAPTPVARWGQALLSLVLIVPLTPLGKNPPEVTFFGLT